MRVSFFVYGGRRRRFGLDFASIPISMFLGAAVGALLTDLLIRKGNIFRPVTPLPVQGESDESAIAGKGSVVQFDRIAAGTSARDGEDRQSK